MPKKNIFFRPPIYTLPKFRHLKKKTKKNKIYFATKMVKFRPEFKSLKPPRIKEDSQYKRRIQQKSTKIQRGGTAGFFRPAPINR